MLRRIAPSIRIWKDRYAPPAGDDDAELAESPDLGPDFEFQPRPGARCPGLERVHCLSYPATLSLGVITGDIPAISEGALQLADKLAGLLYAEDIEHHLRAHARPTPSPRSSATNGSPSRCRHPRHHDPSGPERPMTDLPTFDTT